MTTPDPAQDVIDIICSGDHPDAAYLRSVTPVRRLVRVAARMAPPVIGRHTADTGAGGHDGDTRRRSDGRVEVADTAAATAAYGCPADDWCILAAGHPGECCEGREVWAGPDMPYAADTEPGDSERCSFCGETRDDISVTGGGQAICGDCHSQVDTGPGGHDG